MRGKLARIEIDANVAQGEYMGTHPFFPTHMRVDLRTKLDDTERFADIVVGAEAQPEHGILLSHLRSEEENRGVYQMSDAAYQLEAVHTGHHHIAENKIVP